MNRFEPSQATGHDRGLRILIMRPGGREPVGLSLRPTELLIFVKARGPATPLMKVRRPDWTFP